MHFELLGHKYLFTKVPRQCPLILLAKLIKEKARHSEVEQEQNCAWSCCSDKKFTLTLG
jgi:hypothetical protein